MELIKLLMMHQAHLHQPWRLDSVTNHLCLVGWIHHVSSQPVDHEVFLGVAAAGAAARGAAALRASAKGTGHPPLMAAIYVIMHSSILQ